ncbi:lytic murein transglycosylase [Candidatus Parcubacteria bacterium]|nr:lytic murein transglycosylase [Candidatus Parcubacteria bacterium]
MAFPRIIGVFVLLVCLVGAVLIVPLAFPALAQELSDEEREELEEEYAHIQEEIVQWQRVLDVARAKKNTLQGDVTLLDAEIKQAEAHIRAKNIAIGELGKEIQLKTAHINELSSRIEDGKESLASFLRRQDQIDDLSLVEIALAADNAFALFEDVDHMASVQIGLHEEFAEIRYVRAETEEEREALAEKQEQEQDAKYVVEVKKQEIDINKQEKNQLLAIAAHEEAAYQQVLAERQARAAEIRARLFPLRDTEGIQFGEAVEYAEQASATTGVRAALILAILSQESDLGKNVGNCLVTDLTTGDGKGKNTGTFFAGVMKAPRDTVPFERITRALGKDWSTTPVSCPQPGGYGGAMGPTQFIPSTWELFETRLKAALGVPATNPWNAGHAIMATGLYLADVGGAGGTYSAERSAACKYYSGRDCAGGTSFYGDSVVAKANAFQQDIDFLSDN